MAKTKKIPKRIREQLFGTLNNNIGNFENDPYFVRKAKDAKEFIDRVGLPEELIKKKKKASKKYFGKLDNSIGDFGNHPFFVKKAEEAKEFIKKHGLPKELTKKK